MTRGGGSSTKRQGRTKQSGYFAVEKPHQLTILAFDQGLGMPGQTSPCGGANQPDILQIHVPHVENDAITSCCEATRGITSKD